MSRFAIAAGTAATLFSLGPPALAQSLLSCDVQEGRGSGKNAEIIYTMNCQPVVGGDVTRVTTGVNGEIEVIYGAGRPALGGGPIYILRFSNRPLR